MAAILSLNASSFQSTGIISPLFPSSFQSTGAIEAKLPSRINTSARVAIQLASRFQQTSNFGASPVLLASSFLCSRLTPEIGVDALGSYEWIITPEAPEPTQGS